MRKILFGLLFLLALISSGIFTYERFIGPIELLPARSDRNIEASVKATLTQNPKMLIDALRTVAENSQPNQNTAANAIEDRDKIEDWQDLIAGKEIPSRGPEDADITIIEFFDYACPFCKRAQPVLEELRNKYPNIRYMYVQSPILSQASLTTSAYALAVIEDGKFFDVHEALMDSQGQLNEEAVSAALSKAGVDYNEIRERLKKNPDILNRVRSHIEIAQEIPIKGTPTFLVNGQVLRGAQSLSAFETVINEIRG